MEPTPMPAAPPPPFAVFPPLHDGAEGRTGRRALAVAALVVIVAAAFSIGEVRGAHHHHPATGSNGALSGLSISSLQKLQSQVQQAQTLAQQSADAGTASGDLSALEQQLGISPSSSIGGDAAQLQAELDAINACLGGSSPSVAADC